MNKKLIVVPIVLIMLASLACSVTVNAPGIQVASGKTVTDTIVVPLPIDKSTPTNLTIQFGAGTLSLQPGATDALVNGTVKYNYAELKPVVTANGNSVTIEQGSIKINRLPAIGSKVVNEWSLKLANSPMNLNVKAGAYSGSFELGGLSIAQLDVTDGAAKTDLAFSQPNLVAMSTFTYSTGASQVSLTGLGNANVSDVSFNGGAGSYTLDFSGKLQRDMTVSIDSGVSAIIIRIPAGVSAQVTSDSTLSSVTATGSWQQQGSTYQQTGSGFKIIILVKMGAGSLQLENSQ